MGIFLKYQSIQAFDKHLEQSAKVALSPLFLVVSSCSYERRKIVDRIFHFISKSGKPAQLLYRDGQVASVQDCIEELNTSSLFFGTKVLYLNGVDKLKKGEMTLLVSYMEKPSTAAHLILGTSPFRGLADFYSKGKKELIACDLSEEKPWEQKARLKRMLVDYAASFKKRLLPDAVEHLLECVGASLPSLEQEVEKLITYAMERTEISLSDVKRLCLAQKESPFWELVDQILWTDRFCHGPVEGVDLGLLLPLLSQLRTQLQNALVIATLFARGVPQGEVASYLPSLRPAALEKMLLPARLKPASFLKQALDLLFEAELMAKNSSLEPGLILDLFQSKLTLLKHTYALSASQSSC